MAKSNYKMRSADEVLSIVFNESANALSIINATSTSTSTTTTTSTTTSTTAT